MKICYDFDAYCDSPDLTLYKYRLISFISVHCASSNHTYAAVAAADLLKKSRKSTPLNRQKAGKLGENGECPAVENKDFYRKIKFGLDWSCPAAWPGSLTVITVRVNR